MVFPSTTYLIICTFLLRSCKTFQQIMRASPWKQRVCEVLFLGSLQVFSASCSPTSVAVVNTIGIQNFTQTKHPVPEAGILVCSIASGSKNEKLLNQSRGFTHFLKQIRLLGFHPQLRHPYFESPELQFESSDQKWKRKKVVIKFPRSNPRVP